MSRVTRITAVLTLLLLGFDSPGLTSPDETGAGTVPGSQTRDEEIELRLPADLVFEQAPDSLGTVVFRHATHVAFAEGRCVTCHVGLFKILSPTRTTSHAEMEARRSCGACHDGEHAFGTESGDACLNCHGGSGDDPAAGGSGGIAALSAGRGASPGERWREHVGVRGRWPATSQRPPTPPPEHHGPRATGPDAGR